MLHRLGLLVLVCSFAGTAAAETTLCSEILSLPATISTPGVYCLKQDLSTAITENAAITINSNNVIIDCNDHKIGGQAAGPGSNARGIQSSERLNITIRNCTLRGFSVGLWLEGSHGGGHRVEDNRLDGNLKLGLRVDGDGIRVQRNRILDTGRHLAGDEPIAIAAEGAGDIRDNLIEGVINTGKFGGAYGISVAQFDGRIDNNHIGDLVPSPSFGLSAISIGAGGRVDIRNNTLRHSGGSGSRGIMCLENLNHHAVALGNTILGFTNGISPSCVDGHDNDVH